MEYLERLTKSIESLEDNTDKISKIPELLKAMKDLTEEIIKEKDAIFDSEKKLDVLKEAIMKESNNLADLTEENNRVFETMITTIKDEFLKNKKDNIEAVDSISTRLSNKLSVTESNIQTVMNNKLSEVEGNVNELKNVVQECNRNVVKIRNTANQIRIIAIISVVMGIAGIIVGIFV